MRTNLFKFCQPTQGGDYSVHGAVFYDKENGCATVSDRKVLVASTKDYSVNYADKFVWPDGHVSDKNTSNMRVNERFEEVTEHFIFPRYKNLLEEESGDNVHMGVNRKEYAKAVAEAQIAMRLNAGKKYGVVVIKDGKQFCCDAPHASMLLQLPKDGTLIIQPDIHLALYKADGLNAVFFNEHNYDSSKFTADGIYVTAMN